MISRDELERGIRATEARLAEARKDPLVIREIEEARRKASRPAFFDVPRRLTEEGAAELRAAQALFG